MNAGFLGLAIVFGLWSEFHLAFPDRFATAESACELDTCSEELEQQQVAMRLVAARLSLGVATSELRFLARLPDGERKANRVAIPGRSCSLRGPPAVLPA